MKVGIGKAAEILGVHPETLRRWERRGKFEVERTPTNRRQYDLSKLYQIAPRTSDGSGSTLAYARMSSRDQKDDLETQVSLLEAYCAANGGSTAC
jgi:putative resolvase